jgi:tetratricopeptide (TPR) repeat protein
LWERGGAAKSTSVKEFIGAVQLDSRFSAAFVHLGHFYMAQRAGDSDAEQAAYGTRGVKCYEKALKLDSREVDAAKVLARRYLAADATLDVIRVCTAVTVVARGGAMRRVVWAWKLLARLEQQRGGNDNAVLHGQSAVRADALDAECWLVLGEAYSARGSYLASLKALQRSLELDANQPHCRYAGQHLLCSTDVLQQTQMFTYAFTLSLSRYLIGRVYYALGQFIDAVQTYATFALLTCASEVL